MKVFLHTRKPGEDWNNNEEREFVQVPHLGEYLTLRSDSPWYLVKLVIHTPHGHGAVDAEVFAEEVDHLDVMKQTFPEPPEPRIRSFD
jgi:hypothetical protein